MIKNIFSKKAKITYIEIIILLTSIFAISYILYSVTGSVIAQDEGTVCCEKRIDGLSCQDSLPELCDKDFRVGMSSCDSTFFCKRGCCVSNTNGLCNLRTSEIDCTNMNGTFYQNENCNINECRKGCCTLGGEAIWTTEANCRFESNAKDKEVPMNFNTEISTWLKCMYSTKSDQKGACVYMSEKERKCVLTTLDDCIIRTGSESNFVHNSTLCSDPALNTTCKAKDHKGCLENKEDVYWFDSCNNPEDVSEDCNLAGGSFCGKEKDSDKFYCKDINCIVDGKKRNNGESWCEYEGAIGIDESKNLKDRYGRDTVGSRHIRHICYMGTERIEPCTDYRNEICVETNAKTPQGENFAQSNCRVNNWRQCLEISSKRKNIEEMEKECLKIPDCFVKEIDMDGGFHFKVCLPAYPPGFKLNDDFDIKTGVSVPNSANAICDIATQRCTETWICSIFGCWCVDSCKCHTKYFTQKMNEFCVSLGDCGAYVNFVGSYTEGGIGSKSSDTKYANPTKSLLGGDSSSYIKNAGPQKNQKPASPGKFEFFETLNPEGLSDVVSDDGSIPQNLTPFQRELLTVAGAMGSPLLLKMLSMNVTDEELSAVAKDSRLSSFVGYFNGFSSMRSAITAQIMYKEKKAGGFEAIAAMIAGLIAYAITQSLILSMMSAIMGFLFAMAWIMYIDIDFYCDSWEIPTGGKDCNKCNKLDIPCTDYKCESLGTKCKFINKGTKNELCITLPPNSTLPKIMPLESVITPGFSYSEIKDNSFKIVKSSDNGCIEAYSTVKIGIKVDPFAKCKFGTDPKMKYEEMPEYFGLRGTSILPVHQMDLYFPSPDALRNKYNITEEEAKKLGEINMYVKCKSADGFTNPEAYHISACIKRGPDLTPPIIYVPEANKSYTKYNTQEKELMFYVTNEYAAECKWSIKDQDFDTMENKATCLRVFTQHGIPCNTIFTGVLNNTKFFLRCKDTTENKNKMMESYVYELFISKNQLSITETKPEDNQEIIKGKQPFAIDFKVKTSGGAEDGKAVCKYLEQNNMYSDRFTSTNSNLHTFNLSKLVSGNYRFKITCEDIGGNIAENMTSFKVIIDQGGPKIVRAFSLSGYMNVMTSENSICRYEDKRNFDYENASFMSGNLEKDHSFYASPKLYNIQCEDEFGNKGDKMTIVPY